MTRGKHGNAAARRRESAEVQSEISTYQAAVKRLTAENRDLCDRLAAEQRSHTADVRALKAMLDEGLSPELLAMRQKLAADAEKARARDLVRVRQLMRLLDEHEVRLPDTGWHRLAEIFGVQQGVVFENVPNINRRTRRARRSSTIEVSEGQRNFASGNVK